MFRLTREVRFALNPHPDQQLSHPPWNSYAGYPSLTALGVHLAVRVTVSRDHLEPESQYLVNIKTIDESVRRELPHILDAARSGRLTPQSLLRMIHSQLAARLPGWVDSLTLMLSPFLTLSVSTSEASMMRLSQKFEFSACHRLHNPALSDAVNRRTFGKCNNPLGHGHNYELQVTLIGSPNESGLLVNIPDFECTVAQTVIERFDHKNLNEELPEFRELIPSVENIAKVIYGLLKPKLQGDQARLASVTVWETPKTWCEYSE
jgi:6-pyruvoyltetrahydropterin/6-carboxytetrahydropterin synthase